MRPTRFFIRAPFILAVLFLAAPTTSSQAAEIIMKSGFRMEGKLGKVSGLADNPLKPDGGAGEIDNRLIVLVDDGLRRTFVCTYQVREALESEPLAMTRIKTQQRVAPARARRIGMVGPILGVENWDDFGRRKFMMQSGQGPLTIIQGMTEITPVWTKVEGLMSGTPYQWDMRIATSSIPRDTLSAVLMNQIDTADVDQRRQIVKLYIESDRYQDASKELIRMFEDFPELRKEMTDLSRDLRQMSARRLMKEIELRQAAGQDRLAHRMLTAFPEEGVASTMLGQVREKLGDYDKKVAQGELVLAKLDENAKLVKDAVLRTRIKPIQQEIKEELNIHTLDRFGDFLRLADSEKLEAEQKVSLAISNWLLGAGGGIENLAVSLSVYNTRNLTRDYLQTTRRDERVKLLEALRQEEGATPGYIAKLLAHMKPPVVTKPDDAAAEADDAKAEAAQMPGLYRLTVPGPTGMADFNYHVQLPPEYDPYKRYPVVVTLNGSATRPIEQIDWWAGVYNKDLQLRMGQAARRGYIVIAPEWTRKHQRKYEYSAREHAAVLFSLRDACKRFSADTDRVFLSGHSMGGDAAWDIGLAHPDLWAGVIPIVATADKYVSRYWENAKNVPFYFVAGEMDGDRMSVNGPELDRYLTRTGFDCVVVEFLGRGHEDFIDEIQRLFDWMDLHERDFGREKFEVSTLRTWDNFFWWAELDQMPSRSVIAPVLFDDKVKDVRPILVEGRVVPEANRVRLVTGAGKATIYLSPEIVDFDKRISISVNTLRDISDNIRPQIETILEDARGRGDRQHPFWAKVEVSTGRR
jgi:predicted esterase